jgi:hypothetical protein
MEHGAWSMEKEKFRKIYFNSMLSAQCSMQLRTFA